MVWGGMEEEGEKKQKTKGLIWSENEHPAAVTL